MRTEKQFLTREYVARLNESPFFLVVDYRGLNVGQFTELRKRLAGVGAELHVVKNSVFRVAAQEAGIGDLGGSLIGQGAVVTGESDVSAAAKVVKTFASEFDKPKLQFGFLEGERLEKETLLELADLPPLPTLRAQFMGVLQEPANRLVRLLNTPASQLARVLQARSEKS